MKISNQSVLRAAWQFDEAAPLPAQYCLEELDTYQVEARILPNGEPGLPSLLSIHGARSDYTKLNGLLYPLQALGIASLGFNLSGHSAASGVALAATSLQQNLQEALHFARLLGPGLQAVAGHSLGGALALKVAQAHPCIRKIILSCPALYPEAAYQAPFGAEFKAAISTPFGFMDSPSLNFLRQFDGEVMLIIGEYDGLPATDFAGRAGTSAGQIDVPQADGSLRACYSAIPYEVIAALETAITPTRLHKRVLPACDHAVAAWLRADATRAAQLAAEVAGFLRG